MHGECFRVGKNTLCISYLMLSLSFNDNHHGTCVSEQHHLVMDEAELMENWKRQELPCLHLISPSTLQTCQCSRTLHCPPRDPSSAASLSAGVELQSQRLAQLFQISHGSLPHFTSEQQPPIMARRCCKSLTEGSLFCHQGDSLLPCQLSGVQQGTSHTADVG